ncbi:ESX secretion-associated protein EspG [Nocardia sp. NPDC056100]|uniref:ESX secretion-associated protein EspG n=1 Tax=Nocardia sp. NPDC056100 TaxID=3345712 RepID=UPI0035DFA103
MWSFTESEFFVLWQDILKENLPLPFLYTSRNKARDAFDEEMRQARESVEQTLDARTREMIAAASGPDLYLAVSAWNEQTPLEPSELIRILAVRQGSKGYVLTQKIGESFWYGAGYSVVECDPLRISDEVVRALPDVSAGQQGDIVLAAAADESYEYEYGRSSIVDVSAPSTETRSARFMSAPTDRAGEIVIAQGRSIYGPRGVTQRVLGWRDLRDDGRYVVADQNPSLAVSADAKRLVTLINSQVADVVRAIKEEREGIRR